MVNVVRVLENIFEEGTNSDVLALLKYTFIALVVCILFIIWLDPTNVHSYVFLFFAVGLIASFTWFMKQMETIKAHPAPDADAKTR